MTRANDAARVGELVEHDGGPCPIDPDAWIEPQFRGEPDPTKGILRAYGRAWQYAWHHDGAEDDIIAYRVLPDPTASPNRR